MPVNATRVTTLYAYALPGPPQSFSAKTEAVVTVTSYTNHQQLRAWKMRTLIPFLAGLLRWL